MPQLNRQNEVGRRAILQNRHPNGTQTGRNRNQTKQGHSPITEREQTE